MEALTDACLLKRGCNFFFDSSTRHVLFEIVSGRWGVLALLSEESEVGVRREPLAGHMIRSQHVETRSKLDLVRRTNYTDEFFVAVVTIADELGGGAHPKADVANVF